MQTDVAEVLVEVLPEIYQKHPDLYAEKYKYTDYLKGKIYDKSQNEIILTELEKKLIPTFGQEYNKEDLFYMQKMYLLYPKNVPEKLLALSWDHIKIILDLFAKEKREYYINVCFDNEWDINVLKKAILHNEYEKFCFLKQKYKKASFSQVDFHNCLDYIWEE